MKKLTTLALIFISTISSAQNLHFGTKENFTFSLAIDPLATNKEKSPNLVAELEYIHSFMYIKATTQLLPSLQGGYLDYGIGVGLNTTFGYFEKTRLYGGGRLCLVRRETYTYPLAGFEGGIDHNITDKIFIGIRSTGDYRADFKYSGADPKIRYSTFIRLGYKW